MSFEISTARMDITPHSGGNPFMGGYGVQSGPREVEGDEPYSQPLYARCAVIWDAGHPFAIVSLDILGIPRAVHLAVRSRLVRLADWASSDIVLLASHTHNGPVIGRTLDPVITYDMGAAELAIVDAYTSWLQDRIVAVVQTALSAARTDVTLEYRVTSAGFAFNRVGLATVESDVPVLTARRGDGSLRAVLFSYGCHPVSAGWQQRWDGDWPAEACDVVEDESGAFALFIPGPAGDQDPVGMIRSWALRDDHGNALGYAVLDAAESPGRELTGPISSDLREATLPLDLIETPGNLAAVRAAFEVRVLNPAGLPAWYQRHGEAMIARIDDDSYSTSVQNPSQVWRIDGDPGLQFAFVGGELVSGYGAYFRLRYGGVEELLIGGYANETNSYIPSNEFLLPLASSWGSYEGGWDPDSPGIAGGSMTIYPQIAHFLAGATGVEAAVIDALTEQLA
jgi:neutral ceramidase